jgi:hypothetical protein
VIPDQSLKLSRRHHIAQRPAGALRELPAKPADLIAQTFFW